MRKRAIFAVLAGITAAGGFIVPSAYADETVGDIQITGVTVNGGKDITVGLADKTITVLVTATDPSGIWDADFHLWRGTDPDNPADYIKPNEDTTPADCVASGATTSTCSKTFTFEPDGWLTNADAGAWKVGVQVWANDDSRVQRDAYTSTRIQRFSKLTVNASPDRWSRARPSRSPASSAGRTGTPMSTRATPSSRSSSSSARRAPARTPPSRR